MRKDELVAAITKVQRRLRRKADAETKAKPKSTKIKATKIKGSSNGKAVASKASPRKSNSSVNKPIPQLKPPRVSAKTARIRAQLRKRRESIQQNKDLSTGTLVGGSAVRQGASRTRAAEPHQDRVILLVRDSFWLQANWEITRQSVERAAVGLV